MSSAIVWTLVILVSTAGTAAALSLVERTWVGRARPWRLASIVALGGVVFLVVAGLLYQVSAVAELDGRVVAELAESRNESLVAVMTFVTLTGDTVPTFVIAAVLALVIYRQGNHPLACWMLPVVIAVELVLQFAMGEVFSDLTIGDVQPGVPVTNHGTLPSGSVARLLSVFLVASCMWSSQDPRGARRVASLGGVLVIVETVSRLYLARHLVGDIAGGLALGLILGVAFSLVIQRRFPSPATRGDPGGMSVETPPPPGPAERPEPTTARRNHERRKR